MTATLDATVTDVLQKYAVTTLNGGDHKGESATFSMKDWSGNTLPERGQTVQLTDVRKFAKGWRATSASPIMA